MVTKNVCILSGQLSESNPRANRKSKVYSKRDITIMISFFARFLPAQFAGPKENGRYAFMSFLNSVDWLGFFSSSQLLELESSQRSGTNSSVRGEKYDGLRWKS